MQALDRKQLNVGPDFLSCCFASVSSSAANRRSCSSASFSSISIIAEHEPRCFLRSTCFSRSAARSSKQRIRRPSQDLGSFRVPPGPWHEHWCRHHRAWRTPMQVLCIACQSAKACLLSISLSSLQALQAAQRLQQQQAPVYRFYHCLCIRCRGSLQGLWVQNRLICMGS